MRTPLAIALALVAVLGACGDDDDTDAARAPQAGETGPTVEDPGPVHVHGLGVDPKDGALFVATHTGLFRAPAGEQTAERVADRYQDTMGFTVIGPNRFLGSGHPDGREGLPPFLGLIRSDDAGETWQEVSRMGETDLHVLEASRSHVYGFGSDYETRSAQFLVSTDGGESWRRRPTPAPLFSLAIAPDDPKRIVAAAEDGLYSSADAGKTFRPLGAAPGPVAWLRSGTIIVLDGSGRAMASEDGGRSFEPRGEIGGEPAAFDAAGNELYAALHDGVVKRSTDGGRSWTVRSRPRATVSQ